MTQQCPVCENTFDACMEQCPCCGWTVLNGTTSADMSAIRLAADTMFKEQYLRTLSVEFRTYQWKNDNGIPENDGFSDFVLAKFKNSSPGIRWSGVACAGNPEDALICIEIILRWENRTEHLDVKVTNPRKGSALELGIELVDLRNFCLHLRCFNDHSISQKSKKYHIPSCAIPSLNAEK